MKMTAAVTNFNFVLCKLCANYDVTCEQFGSYELAPPPDSIWAGNEKDSGHDDAFTEKDDFFNLEFEDEDEQESLGSNPMMPW